MPLKVFVHYVEPDWKHLNPREFFYYCYTRQAISWAGSFVMLYQVESGQTIEFLKQLRDRLIDAGELVIEEN